MDSVSREEREVAEHGNVFCVDGGDWMVGIAVGQS